MDVYGIVELRTKYVPTAGSRQLVEQPLCFFQVLGVEALGEPAVDGREQLAGFAHAALVAHQTCVARRGAQLPGFCLLCSRPVERGDVGALRPRRIAP